MLDNKVKFEDLASLKNSFERVTKVLKDNPGNEAHLKEFYSHYLSVFEPNHHYNKLYELSTFNFNDYFKIINSVYSDDEKHKLKVKYFDELYSIYKNFKKFAKEHLKNDLVICKREYDYNYIRYLLNDIRNDEYELKIFSLKDYSFYGRRFCRKCLEFTSLKYKTFFKFDFRGFEELLTLIAKKDYSKNNNVEKYKEYYKNLIEAYENAPSSFNDFYSLSYDLELLEYSYSCNSYLLPNYEKLEFFKHHKNSMYLTRDLFYNFQGYTIDKIDKSIYILEKIKTDFNLI